MAKEVIFLIEEAPEGGYLARALGHGIFTEAGTWDELKAAIRDAVECHFDEDERPEMERVGAQPLAGPSWSHRHVALPHISAPGYHRRTS